MINLKTATTNWSVHNWGSENSGMRGTWRRQKASLKAYKWEQIHSFQNSQLKGESATAPGWSSVVMGQNIRVWPHRILGPDQNPRFSSGPGSISIESIEHTRHSELSVHVPLWDRISGASTENAAFHEDFYITDIYQYGNNIRIGCFPFYGD